MSTPPPNQPPPHWGQQQPQWGQQPPQPESGWGQPPQPPAWGQPQPAAAKPKSNTKAIVIAATIGVLLVIGVIANATDKHAGDPGADTAAPAPATSTKAKPAAPASQAPAPAPTTAAPSPSHNADYQTGQKIAAWYQGGGNDKMQAIGNDGTAMSNDAAAMDTIQLTADCGTLKGHVRDAQAYAPIPDDQAQQHWSKALADYKKAADDCIAGASSGSAEKISAAGDEEAAGTSEISQVTARISEISAAAQ